MSQIYGTINIDFETDKPIDEAKFNEIKKKLSAIMDDFETMVMEAVSETGIECDSVHPVMLDMDSIEFKN